MTIGDDNDDGEGDQEEDGSFFDPHLQITVPFLPFPVLPLSTFLQPNHPPHHPSLPRNKPPALPLSPPKAVSIPVPLAPTSTILSLTSLSNLLATSLLSSLAFLNSTNSSLRRRSRADVHPSHWSWV